MKRYYLENIEPDWLYDSSAVDLITLAKNIADFMSIEYVSSEYIKYLLSLSLETDCMKLITILCTQFRIHSTEDGYNLFVVREDPPLEIPSAFKYYNCHSLKILKACILNYNLRFSNPPEIEVGTTFRDKFGILFEVVYK